jgi:peptide/nickel transport system substrate-binding protein
MVFGANTDLESYDVRSRARPSAPRRRRPRQRLLHHALWTNNNPLRIQIAEIVQAQLAEIGISVESGARVVDVPQRHRGRRPRHVHPRLGDVTADADYGLYALFHSSNFGSAGNRTFWSSDRGSTSCSTSAAARADPELRLRLLLRGPGDHRDEAPWIFLNTQIEAQRHRSNVTGFVPHPAGHHRLYNVQKN